MLSSQDIARIKVTVGKSFDTEVTVKRIADPTATDTSGHQLATYTSIGTALINTYKPSASQLQSYAGIIGSQQALMIRYAEETDIRENDILTCNGIDWLVHNTQKAESYTFAYDALMVTIT